MEKEIQMYEKAYKELYVILTHTDEGVTNKIPERFMEFVKGKMSDEYEFNIDEEKSLGDQVLLEETRHLLDIVRKNYLNAEVTEQIAEAMEEVIEEENEMMETENVVSAIEEVAIEDVVIEQTGEVQALTVVKQKNIFVRFFEKLKQIFIRNKEKAV